MHVSKLLVATMLLVLVAGSALAQMPEVKINEVKAKGTEFIELYNAGATDVDVTDWYLTDQEDQEPLAGVIAAGGFMVIETILDLSNSGDEVELWDNAGRLIDDVAYGNVGGAPLGYNSIGRHPDGDDTDDYARDWEYLDDSVDPAGETPGAPNAQGSPALGSGVMLNEMDPYGTGQPDALDRVEIYNPGAADVNIQGYYLSDGDGYCQITAAIVIPAGGHVVLTELAAGEGMDCTGNDVIEFSSTDVAYLYDADAVRIDQLGLTDAPYLDPEMTLQRCPDGNGPNDGYDYPSSGGDTTYIVYTQTEGGPNCGVVPVEPATWGAVKAIYER